MSEDSKVVEFPVEAEVSTAPYANVQVANDLPEAAEEFYNHLHQTTVAAFQTAAPFQNKHAALDQALNETLRYLELASMYMDRFILYVKNPQILQKSQEDSNAPA